jgi:hypothetical protein
MISENRSPGNLNVVVTENCCAKTFLHLAECVPRICIRNILGSEDKPEWKEGIEYIRSTSNLTFELNRQYILQVTRFTTPRLFLESPSR